VAATGDPFLTVAAVQAAPIFLDREATVAKACALIREAGAGGARLAVFPEAFIPAYPLWVWHIPAGETHALRELYTELLANAVTIPSDITDRLCTAAREAGASVVIGERGERRGQKILQARIDLRELHGPRWQLDVAGHYARPDIFSLAVDRALRPMIRSAEVPPKSEEPPGEP